MRTHLASVPPRPPPGAWLLLGSLLLPLAALAQTAAPPPEAAKAAEAPVQLDPFQVQADSDTSYGALNSRSITAFNTALDKIPVSADIYDQTFMNDVGATSVEGLLQTYSAGVGPSALSAGATAFENQPGDRVNLVYTQLRGMETPNIQRNSLLFLGTLGGPGGTSIGFTSNFDLERVEVIDGPNALLYDGGGAGGVINLVTTGAPLLSGAFTNVYTFDSGPLQGFDVGGTVIANWWNHNYYYYPNGLSAAGPSSGRSLFALPTLARLDLILGYTRKFRRIGFSSSLNVYNLLNHYDVIIYPDLVTGWTNLSNLNANFNQQPRSYAWTNRITF